MTKDKNNNMEKTSRKRPPKTRHIDVRFTEEEYNEVVHNARLSGRSKSTYLHDLGISHKPSLPMTAGQEEALKGLIGQGLNWFMCAMRFMPCHRPRD